MFIPGGEIWLKPQEKQLHMITRASTLEQKDQKSQKDQNNCPPRQVCLCKTLNTHAVESQNMAALHIGKTTHTENKRECVLQHLN